MMAVSAKSQSKSRKLRLPETDNMMEKFRGGNKMLSSKV
jgi:hypothetical protein